MFSIFVQILGSFSPFHLIYFVFGVVGLHSNQQILIYFCNCVFIFFIKVCYLILFSPFLKSERMGGPSAPTQSYVFENPKYTKIMCGLCTTRTTLTKGCSGCCMAPAPTAQPWQKNVWPTVRAVSRPHKSVQVACHLQKGAQAVCHPHTLE